MSMDSQSGCKSKVGLLFLRDCNRPLHDNCERCGRPVCKQHRIATGAGSLCTECASEEDKYSRQSSIRRRQRRYRYYDSYHYYPYYYGSSRYYSDRDYRTFDNPDRVVAAGDPNEAGESDDGFGEADDYMES